MGRSGQSSTRHARSAWASRIDRLEPERRAAACYGLETGAVPQRTRHAEQLGVRTHERVRQDNAHPARAAEDVRREQVLLRVPAVLPLRRVVVRQADVVDLYEDTRLKARQHFEEEGGDVGVLQRAMRAVEEQD